MKTVSYKPLPVISGDMVLHRPVERTGATSLAAVAYRLRRFEEHYQVIAQPIAWRFNRRDLARLANKLDITHSRRRVA